MSVAEADPPPTSPLQGGKTVGISFSSPSPHMTKLEASERENLRVELGEIYENFAFSIVAGKQSVRQTLFINL